MKRSLFTTAQDAEAAFYEALEKADLEAMMAVWADDDDIVCVHPGGMRLAGVEQVRESWRQIFSGGSTTRISGSASMAARKSLSSSQARMAWLCTRR